MRAHTDDRHAVRAAGWLACGGLCCFVLLLRPQIVPGHERRSTRTARHCAALLATQAQQARAVLARRYGAVPVVRKTGGLADTVRDVASHPTGEGNGYTFDGSDEVRACV